MVFDILCGEIPEVRALENGPPSTGGAPRRAPPRRAAVGNRGGQKEEDLVSVTIPEGAKPGQTIAIMASGGTRRVKATVPAGLKPGDTFLVRLATPINPEPATAVSTHRPTSMATSTPHFGPSLDEWLAPAIEEKKSDWSKPVLSAGDNREEQHQHRDPPSYAARGFIAGREAPSTHDYYHHYATEHITPRPKEIEAREQPQTIEYEQAPRQKLLLVQVPPGMPPGIILQVEIPGEGRTVAAQVPPGVDAFHVVYTPQQRPITPRATTWQPHNQPAATFVQQQQPQPMRQQPPQEHVQRQQEVPQELPSKPKRKLLLVRVPPETPQGTTLHVSIPDEPGRILAAVVPPGNVTEFHVSYEPRKQQQKQHHDQPSGQVVQTSHHHHHETQQVQYYGETSVEGKAAGDRAHEHYDNTY